MCSSRESLALMILSPSVISSPVCWMKGRWRMQNFWISVRHLIPSLTVSFWTSCPTVRQIGSCYTAQMNCLNSRAQSVVVHGTMYGWMMVTRGQFWGKFSDDTKLGDVAYYGGRSGLAEGPSYDEALGNKQWYEVQQNCARVRSGARKNCPLNANTIQWYFGICPLNIKMGIVEIAATVHPNSHTDGHSSHQQKSFAVQTSTSVPAVKAFFTASGKKWALLGCDSSHPAVDS